MKCIRNGIAVSALAVCMAAPVFAAAPHSTASGTTHMMTGHTTSTMAPASTPRALGQPNQTCGSATAPNTPGNAANARGSAFNPKGVAGTMYAGQQDQNNNNPASVSQYDVACSHQPR